MNKSHKSIVTQIPLLREGGVPKGRGGRYTNSIVNESFMHSPTTSPLRVLLLPEGGDLRYYRLLVGPNKDTAYF